MLFRATISPTGKLLTLEGKIDKTPEILIRLTERLVIEAFPEINSALYNN
jgi:hypothetical protein